MFLSIWFPFYQSDYCLHSLLPLIAVSLLEKRDRISGPTYWPKQIIHYNEPQILSPSGRKVHALGSKALISSISLSCKSFSWNIFSQQNSPLCYMIWSNDCSVTWEVKNQNGYIQIFILTISSHEQLPLSKKSWELIPRKDEWSWPERPGWKTVILDLSEGLGRASQMGRASAIQICSNLIHIGRSFSC